MFSRTSLSQLQVERFTSVDSLSLSKLKKMTRVSLWTAKRKKRMRKRREPPLRTLKRASSKLS